MTRVKTIKELLLDYLSKRINNPVDYKCDNLDCKGTNKLGSCKCALDRALDNIYPPIKPEGSNQ